MISVIIPCYNYGHLIGDAIESILKQTYHDLEVIIINDGSSDNTEEVAQSYVEKDKRVRYRKYPNSGLGLSRNRGIAEAKGEYFQFLDADDLLEENKFEIQTKLFSEHPEADIVYGSVRYFTKNPFDPDDRKFTFWGKDEEWMPKLNGNGKRILATALKAYFSHLSSPLFKRKVIEKVGLFDNTVSAVADYDFLLRCVIAGAFFYYHDTPGSYSLVRWHPDNMSKDLKLMAEQEIVMRRNLMPGLKDSKEAELINTHAIKIHQLRLKNSWKTQLASGGKLRKIASLARAIGLEKTAKAIMYGTFFGKKN